MYVPWISRYDIIIKGSHAKGQSSIGYAFVWNSPKEQLFIIQEIDLTRIFLEFVAVTMLFGVVYILLRRVLTKTSENTAKSARDAEEFKRQVEKKNR